MVDEDQHILLSSNGDIGPIIMSEGTIHFMGRTRDYVAVTFDLENPCKKDNVGLSHKNVVCDTSKNATTNIKHFSFKCANNACPDPMVHQLPADDRYQKIFEVNQKYDPILLNPGIDEKKKQMDLDDYERAILKAIQDAKDKAIQP